MIRRSRVLRFLSLQFAVFLFLFLVFYFADIDIFHLSRSSTLDFKIVSNEDPTVVPTKNVSSDVTIVVFTPTQMVGNQLERTLDTVNELNGETGKNCRKRCEWTMDTNRIRKADAVVFYFFTIGFNM